MNSLSIYFLVILMTIIGSVASLFLKRASNFKNIKELFVNINLYIGALLYILSAVINIVALKFLNYSTVLPMTSLTYIWTMIISYLFLKEKISFKKMVGVSFIFSGCICIAIF